MFDAALRRVITPPLDRAGRWLAAIGVSANAITWGGLLIGLLAVPALADGHYLTALGLIALNRLADGLDGAVARQSALTDFGGFLDIVADFLFYAAIPFGFALARPEDAVWLAFLLFSFFGSGASFLAFAIIAAKRGLQTQARGAKSFFYLGGLAEGSETIAAFVLMCLMPQHVATIAGAFGVLCWLTTAGRMLAAARTFRLNFAPFSS
ncbi:MAG: CDP-alcohol phosphatidyltransferase family protein [Alphaproteobacteria bacterium]|nr:CDP-alcohol phosphatidyltransferase family protein [Alphaproteobacteria bacterium]